MVENRRTRRLSTIIVADVADYTKHVEADMVGTVSALKQARHDVIEPAIRKHNGRLVKLTGDGFVVEFDSAQEGVACAVAMQRELRPSALEFRMGVSLGDVIDDGEDIHGEGVIVAARIEGLADRGGVFVSGIVFEAVRNHIEVNFRDLGEHEGKNLSSPLRVYEALLCDGPSAPLNRLVKSPSLPDKPSVAVLPFDNMSGDPQQDYLADGMVEALTAALSRIRDFFVIARNSTFALKGTHKDVKEIGRELGVAYAIEGSVQRAGNRVRITVQLVETGAGSHIWANRFDGALDDIFDLQDQITQQVAGALQPSIRLAEIERSSRKRPQNMGAYDYTMRAFRHVWVLEKDEAECALELLKAAIDVDPDFPLALALSAWCHAQRSVYNWTDDPSAALARALALAERAANLSSDDPLILAVLGTVHTFARNYGTARVLLERAISIDPNAAWAHSRLGWLETYADRPAEAREYFETALRLSPNDPMNFNNFVGLASSHQVAGDDALAADLFQRALHERKNAHWIHRNLAPALLGAGRIQEAKESFEIMRVAYPDLTVGKFKKAMVFSPNVLDRIGNQLAELGLPKS